MRAHTHTTIVIHVQSVCYSQENGPEGKSCGRGSAVGEAVTVKEATWERDGFGNVGLLVYNQLSEGNCRMEAFHRAE